MQTLTVCLIFFQNAYFKTSCMFRVENNIICFTFRETERGSVVSKSYKRMQNKGLDCDLYVSSVVLYQERR